MSDLHRNLQQKLVNQIKASIPHNVSLVEELADLLGISTDSVYRRLRCETEFTLNEVALVSEKFKIPVNLFLPDSVGSVSFSYDSLDNNQGFHQYLLSILKVMQTLRQTSNSEVIYAAIDIPIFHHFSSQLMIHFKAFYWMKEVVNLPDFQGKKFEGELDNPLIEEITKEIYKVYAEIPSTEIWTEDSVNSTLKQIEFYWESGQFAEKKLALNLCYEFTKIMNAIEKQAESSLKVYQGQRGQPATYTLYSSDIEIGNNCILTKQNNTATTYLSFQTFNKLSTTSPAFAEQTQVWINNLIKKSTMISGSAQKQRYKFFRKIYDKIHKLQQMIENYE